MPADAFVDERHLPALGLSNAWGYNPVVLGAPDPRLAPGGWAEVRAATDALHAAGMEAILDVVLNHNGESDEFGPTLSFRGLDNASYFRLAPDDPARYVNDMGCGNCLALDRPVVVRMALAALKRWMIFGGVDGFRFDLAVALGRRAGGFDPQAPIFQAIAADPLLAQRQADRRAVGRRPRRLSARRLSRGLGRMERPLPRRRAPLLARRRRHARRAGDAHRRLARRVRRRRPRRRRASTSSSPTTASRSPTSSPTRTSTTKPTANTTATGPNENYSWNHGVEGADRRPRGRSRRARATCATSSRCCSSARGDADAGDGRRSSATASAATTTPTPRTTRSPGSTGAQADKALIAFVGASRRGARATIPRCRRAAWLTGQPFDADGLPDVEWRDADGPLPRPRNGRRADGDVLVADPRRAGRRRRRPRRGRLQPRRASGLAASCPRRAKASVGGRSSTPPTTPTRRRRRSPTARASPRARR